MKKDKKIFIAGSSGMVEVQWYATYRGQVFKKSVNASRVKN